MRYQLLIHFTRKSSLRASFAKQSHDRVRDCFVTKNVPRNDSAKHELLFTNYSLLFKRMSLAHTLSHHALDKVQQRLHLREIGNPYLTLTSPMSPAPVGMARVFTGERIRKMVYIGLTVAPIGLDSHMFFAFTPPDSLVPHFTLDSVLAGPHFAFHLDLIPRVDLGANLEYLNAAFQPLTAEFDSARKIEGLTPAQLSPRQYALISPWMLAFRANETAFAQIEKHVDAYLEHWFGLVEHGVKASVTSDASTLAARDQANRDAIFNPGVDPVWAQVERLIGAPMGEKLRALLRNHEVERE